MTSRGIKRAEGKLINPSDLTGSLSAQLIVGVKGQAKSQMGHISVWGFDCVIERTVGS